MRVVLGTILAFVIGLIVVYVITVAGGLWYIQAYNVRDGGMPMAVMFAIGPLAAFIGGIIAAAIAGVWLSRRERAHIEAGRPVKPWPLWALLALAMIAGAFIYLGVWSVIGIAGPPSYTSYGAALTVSLLPPVIALLTVGIAVWRILQRRRGTP